MKVIKLNESIVTNSELQSLKRDYSMLNSDKTKREFILNFINKIKPDTTATSIVKGLSTLPEDFIIQWANAMKFDEINRGTNNVFIEFLANNGNDKRINIYKQNIFNSIYNLYVSGADINSKSIKDVPLLYNNDLYNRPTDESVAIGKEFIKDISKLPQSGVDSDERDNAIGELAKKYLELEVTDNGVATWNTESFAEEGVKPTQEIISYKKENDNTSDDDIKKLIDYLKKPENKSAVQQILKQLENATNNSQ